MRFKDLKIMYVDVPVFIASFIHLYENGILDFKFRCVCVFFPCSSKFVPYVLLLVLKVESLEITGV